MNGDWTVGDIFEDIADRVATARTRALMGERQEALAILQRARMDYMRFRDVLQGYPGTLALAHSLEVAQIQLCEERAQDRDGEPDQTVVISSDGSVRAA